MYILAERLGKFVYEIEQMPSSEFHRWMLVNVTLKDLQQKQNMDEQLQILSQMPGVKTGKA